MQSQPSSRRQSLSYESSSTAPSYKTGMLNTHTQAHVQNRHHEQTISSTDHVSIIDRASCASHRAHIAKPSLVNLLELFCDYVLDRNKLVAKVKFTNCLKNGLFTQAKLFRTVAVEPRGPVVRTGPGKSVSRPDLFREQLL